MEASFCIEALKEASEEHSAPEIFNTDQGRQFTIAEYTGMLKHHDLQMLHGL